MRLLWFATLLGLAAPAFAQDSSTRFAGAPRIGSTSGWSVKPRGRVQYDVGDISAPAGVTVPGLGSVDEVRRARLGVEGTAPGGFSYVFEMELSEPVDEIVDATISWRASDRLTLTVGQHNNFQSLDELTSSRFSSFIERAAFTDAFNFERRLGLSGTLTSGPVTAQLGIFHDNLLDVDEGDDMLSVDGRIIYAPRIGGTQFHLGASAHWRDNGDLVARGTTTRYRQRPFIHATDARFLATPALAVDRETSFGLEAAAIRGPFHFAAEAHWLHPDRVTGADPTFFGFYAEAGWFLTGETRGYRGARWDRTRVRRPVEEGGFGAVQLNLRYDYLDLSSRGIVGGIQNGLQLGLTWIPTDYVRFLANYARLSYDDAAIPAGGMRRDYAVDVIGVRAQVDF
ncbi:OprO/OprP family phosphate-selective porin [Sphingosinicella sp.]|uniref:OprO/OprP family phosphate-selective porin n=1 Tax=Sphingosinicella sp. TaxID=1917971 RepID=UPI0040376AC7